MKYVILDELNQPKGIVAAKGFVPKNSMPLSANLENEDIRWLQVEDYDDGSGQLVPTLTINQELKDQIIDQDNAIETQRLADEIHQQKVNKNLQKLEFGKIMKAEVAVINESKGWNVQQTLNLLSNRTVQTIDALLGAGAIETARDTILTSNLSQFYTAEDVSSIVAKINNFLDNQ